MKIDTNRDEIFQKNRGVHPFRPQKEWKMFGRAESRTSWGEIKKMQIKLATICNKNKQEQDAKNNAGF